MSKGTKPLMRVKGRLANLNMDGVELIASLGGDKILSIYPCPQEITEDGVYEMIPDSKGNLTYSKIS